MQLDIKYVRWDGEPSNSPLKQDIWLPRVR